MLGCEFDFGVGLAAPAPAAATQPPKPPQRDPHAKEIRFLKKKLREIANLEAKSSASLNEDQCAKLSRKQRYSQRLRVVTKNRR